jgi:hypothetical protein
MPIPVAACYRLVTGIAGSNPSGGMDVCRMCLYVVFSCLGRGLCDELITRPKESYQLSNEDTETQKGHRKTSIDVLTRKKA